MPRLFTAVELDDGARDWVASIQQRLGARARTDCLRWVRAEHLHLTLVFMGAVTSEQMPRIEDAMNCDVRADPFAMELGGCGAFPERGAPRVLWVGVRRGADRITSLQQSVASRLAGLGVPFEARPFHPHLTVARWRDQSRAISRRDLADVCSGVATVQVDHVALFRSDLSSSGPTHTVLARARLAASSDALH
jgi:2'-5' RNA ligase